MEEKVDATKQQFISGKTESELRQIGEELKNEDQLLLQPAEVVYDLWRLVNEELPPNFAESVDLKLLPPQTQNLYRFISSISAENVLTRGLEQLIEQQGLKVNEKTQENRWGIETIGSKDYLTSLSADIFEKEQIPASLKRKKYQVQDIEVDLIWSPQTIWLFHEGDRQEYMEIIGEMLQKMKTIDPEMVERIQKNGLEIFNADEIWFKPKKRSCVIRDNFIGRPVAVIEEKRIRNKAESEATNAHELVHVGFPHIFSRILTEMVAIRFGGDYIPTRIESSKMPTSVSTVESISSGGSLAIIRKAYAMYLDKVKSEPDFLLSLPVNQFDFYDFYLTLFPGESFPGFNIDDFTYHFAAGYALAIEEEFGREGVKAVAQRASSIDLNQGIVEKSQAEARRKFYARLSERERIEVELYDKEQNWPDELISSTSRMASSETEKIIIMLAITTGLGVDSIKAESIVQKAAEITMKRTYKLIGDYAPILVPPDFEELGKKLVPQDQT